MGAVKLGVHARVVAAAVVSGALAAAGFAATATAATSPNPFPNGTVSLKGHGYGPGIGMGQWGAFGYAAVEEFTYPEILSHFYGGTTLATAPNDPDITVAIIENDDDPVTVTSPSPFSFGGKTFAAGTVVRALLTAAGWQLRTASSCAAPSFTLVAKGLADPVAIPASRAADAPVTDLLTLCRGDGADVTYRGEIEAYDYEGLERTINILPLGQYVADVVPSESSSSWGEAGAPGPQHEPWGFQELEAQAVAARTYALSYEADGGWSSGYADICDSDFCQEYPGVGNESALATRATVHTARQYLELGNAPAQIEYSASTGGYTVAGIFPAVVDAGDSVCIKSSGWTCNPDHTWKASITVKAIESQFPSIGALESVKVTSRNGLGAWHGRVLTIELTGATGTLSESGDAFQAQFSLMSDWFVVQHASSKGSSGGGSPSNRPALAGPASAGSGSGPLPTGPSGEAASLASRR